MCEIKPKMYSFIVDENENKKTKGVNKIVVAIICYNEYKDVLLKKKCLRPSINRIQGKDHMVGTCEVNKILLPYFDNKIYIQNKRYYELSLSCQS